jgi:hypothetical protein
MLHNAIRAVFSHRSIIRQAVLPEVGLCYDACCPKAGEMFDSKYIQE